MAEAPARRLLALRLHGFKSFAERAVVEFGGGISAVVGPNGSGKSNLADALRWVLGEQGRALRSRRSEDVIFAGSDRRAALGMADVTLVLDNSDGLLPVDYRVLELGRRLYRSGENDYLLNRQRVRLKDLVDLLDGAHLADNAFLFIGQGMVDQALALRPEERRPLFEEVAGVRRHERRRRRAEEQLIEAEANLARVEDILGELRPQARRLSAQAEQQATRETAGTDLAAGLIALAHARWHEAAGRVEDASARLQRTRAEADQVAAGLATAEQALVDVRRRLAERSADERARRLRLDEVQAELSAARIASARLAADAAGVERDGQRVVLERDAASASLAARLEELASPVPERNYGLETAVAEAERSLGDALDELAGLRAAVDAHGEAVRAARRAAAARQTELATARQRAADAADRAARERADAAATETLRQQAAIALEAARREAVAAVATERAALDRRDAARAAAEAAEARATAAADRASTIAARAAALRGRVEALAARRREDQDRGLAGKARRQGGQRVDTGLTVDPAFRAAIEGALGDAVHAYSVSETTALALAGDRGVAAIQRPGGRESAPSSDRTLVDFLARVADAGGAPLADAVRQDAAGFVRRLVAATVWVPDLATLLALQPSLPPGWSMVVRDGSAVAGPITIRFGRPEGALERAAEEERLARELDVAQAAAVVATSDADGARAEAVAARSALVEAAALEAAAGAGRRAAEDRERSAARTADSAMRESAWHAGQAERLDADLLRYRDALAALDAAARDGEDGDEGERAPDQVEALAAWQARAEERRARRDRLASDLAVVERTRRDAEGLRSAAQAGAAMDRDRLARADREADVLSERRRELGSAIAAADARLHAAEAALVDARAALDAVITSDEADRRLLAHAEAAAVEQRERLRAADGRRHAADAADLQARLELDLVREQVLVELAGLGELGLTALILAGGAGIGVMAADELESPRGHSTSDDGLEAGAFEAALDGAAGRWVMEAPDAEPPTAGRLNALRRRYHDLGAANPFAVTEYEEVRARLATLETQERDLREAIGSTRTLIAELSALVADQFRTTFQALEGAFDTRFRQLFGGGFAKLSLTDPDDLATTGVEIVARPPGKKAQALAMLSGGERALTAVALLFAMLQVRPVPFCVLDEVDAALDEANVGRFTDALRSLAETTQFIVITHNRGTIEAADALYGITVGEDSVSRIISLRLDEATALAGQGRGEPGGEPELAVAG